MFNFEKRLRKLETAVDQFSTRSIDQIHTKVVRVGLATAGAMLSPAEFQQLVEAFQRLLPELGPEAKADSWEHTKIFLKHLLQMVGLFAKLAPSVRGVMVKKLQNLEVDMLYIKLLQEFIIPSLKGVPEEDLTSIFEQWLSETEGFL